MIELEPLRAIWRKEKQQAVALSKKVLKGLSESFSASSDEILAANAEDLQDLGSKGPLYDRLALSKERIEGLSRDLLRVAELPSPIGETVYEYSGRDSLSVVLKRVPIGLVLIIYEARPNVTVDIFSLALRTGNLVLLKGGTESLRSNRVLVQLARAQLERFGLSPDWVTLLEASRDETAQLLCRDDCIDLCIPRGSAGLIRFVRERSRIPVIETGAGVVCLYCDEFADLQKARRLIENSKMRRLSVCNALDTVLIHRGRLQALPDLLEPLITHQVRIWADEDSLALLTETGEYPADLLERAVPESFGQEYLSAQLALKVVENLEDAVSHIARYGSHHTDVIVTEDAARARKFSEEVDSAVVFVNTASGFSDGGEFGLGAELGISTQKLHARGPMGLEALTCTQWFGSSEGSIRLS